MNREYSIFNGRYTVVLGKRGKVSVISNIVNNFRHDKEMKVNGTGGQRYVNLTEIKGGDSLPYLLSDLKSFVIEESDQLIPLSFDDMKALSGESVSLYDSILSIEEIQDLPHYINDKGFKVYDQALENGFIEYTLYHDYAESNGLLKAHYQITMNDTSSNKVKNLYSRTELFNIKDKVNIKDISDVSNSDIDAIIKLLQEEKEKREYYTQYLKEIGYKDNKEKLSDYLSRTGFYTFPEWIKQHRKLKYNIAMSDLIS